MPAVHQHCLSWTLVFFWTCCRNHVRVNPFFALFEHDSVFWGWSTFKFFLVHPHFQPARDANFAHISRVRYHYRLYLSRSSPRSSLSSVAYYKFELFIWFQDYCYERRRMSTMSSIYSSPIVSGEHTYVTVISAWSKHSPWFTKPIFSREPMTVVLYQKKYTLRVGWSDEMCGSDQKFQQSARYLVFHP